LSGLLKKRIQVDRNLGAVIGVPENATVSYAEIQKGLHKYIRDNKLRRPLRPSQRRVSREAPTAFHVAKQFLMARSSAICAERRSERYSQSLSTGARFKTLIIRFTSMNRL
jgi:hypothetical protein